MTDKLRWLIFGAGAIGTYVGGSLMLSLPEDEARSRVAFVERPAVAAEIRSRGLRLDLFGQEHKLANPAVYGSVAEALQSGPFDVGIYALKSFDTPAALESYRPLIGQMPTILCLSNGVENETLLAAGLGANKVIAGTITAAVGRRAAGDIVLERQRGLGVAAGHPLSEQIVAALNAAGLNTRLYASGLSMKWSKMLTNLTTNASSAILDVPPAAIYADLGLYKIEVRMLREALEVMRALKLEVVSLPGVPVRLISLATALPAAISRPVFAQQASKGRGNKMPSFHIDLHAGRGQSEVDYLNGAVVRFGKKNGIATPVNSTLNDLLLKMTREEISPARYAGKIDEYIALFKPER